MYMGHGCYGTPWCTGSLVPFCQFVHNVVYFEIVSFSHISSLLVEVMPRTVFHTCSTGWSSNQLACLLVNILHLDHFATFILRCRVVHTTFIL